MSFDFGIVPSEGCMVLLPVASAMAGTHRDPPFLACSTQAAQHCLAQGQIASTDPLLHTDNSNLIQAGGLASLAPCLYLSGDV